MARFLLTRLGLAAITLFLLSVLVFVGTNLLPGNVARRKLGNLADQSAVDQLNHQLGTDKPILAVRGGKPLALRMARLEDGSQLKQRYLMGRARELR